MSRLFVAAFAAVILSAAPAPAAPPLAQYVPADAHIYIGWAGIQSPAPGYDESHLKPIIDASNLPQVIDQFIPAMIEFVANQNPEDAESVRQIGAFIQSMIRYPVAIYVGPRPTDDPDALTPAAIICQPDDAEPQLVQQFQALIRQAPLDGPPITIHHHDTGVVALSFNDTSPAFDALISGIASPDAPPPAILADHPPFKAAVTAKHPDPVFAGWCDINAIIGLIDYNNLQRFTRLDDADPRKQLVDQWPKFRDALDLNGLEYLTFTAGFDHGNWLMQSTLQAPAPRQGLAAMFDHGALDARTIAMIPRSASLAAAFQLDLDRLYAEIRATVGRTDRRSQTQFDLALANAAEFVGMDFVDELLPHLGDQWVFYVDNQIGGPGVLGTVVGNRLKDPENAERALRAFAEGIAKRISHYLADGEMSASLRTVRHDQIDIQYLSLPLIAPAWTVHNGNLYMGLYPQTVAAAARYVADEKPSIITNPKCRDLMKKLKPSDIASMQFIDVPALAPHGYATTLMAAQTVFGFADLVGAESPPMVIPPLHEILPHLAPAGSVTWSDENGFHMRSLTPFPGAGSMATMHITSNAQIAAVLFGITVPATVRAQEVASHRMTEENMRGIGIAMHAWANANDGRFPPDLGTLVADGYIIAEQVLNPASPDFDSRLLFFELNVTRLDDIRDWINQNTDYVYLGHYYDVNIEPHAILLYEKITRESSEGIHFLFANSDVSYLPMDVTIEVLQQLHQPIPGHSTLEDYR